MPTRGRLEFTEEERRAIAAAVGAAEEGSRGEIVPVVVAASDRYEAAGWRGALLGALVAAVAAATVHRLLGPWADPAAWIALPPFAGALLGRLAVALVPPLRRFLAGREILDREVRQRAAEEFLSQEVFRTRDRSGILIFLSAFEREVVVLADRGIHEAVPAAEWDAIAREIARGVGVGHPAEALLAAIARCGELLRERRLGARADDRNELPDGLRVLAD
ncbi:MAG TPA: TPM domain-containing protein [Thermoanaerobaculia bacterium]|nr:TPM domain-containing protein [Thermoanaerobaculia bacterium]